MKRSFDGKVRVPIVTDPDDALQSDAVYFPSISGRDLLDKDFVKDVEELHTSHKGYKILGSIIDEESMYIKNGPSVKGLVSKLPHGNKDISLCSVKQNEELPVELPLNEDIQFTIPHSDISNQSNINGVGSYPLKAGVSRNHLGENPSEFDPVRSTWVTTKADKAQLKSNGHTWKTGKWTKEESDLLKKNIENYCGKHNIEDPRDIIYNASKEDRPQFYPTIAAGLNRPVFAVYRRVKRMYDAQNHRGKYSPEEVEKLKNLYKKYGRDWTLIGHEMGRSSDSVKDRCRLVMNGSCNPGKWSEEEEVLLAQAVYSLTGVKEGTSVTSNICWVSVAEKVGTRNQKQCRAKWLNYLNWKMSNGEKWTKNEDAVLLKRIIESGAQSEGEIDWNLLSSGWKSSRSPQWLRIKWWSLKQYYLQEFSNVFEIEFPNLLQALSKIIYDQIQNAWDSKRSRKSIGHILKCEAGAKEVPRKVSDSAAVEQVRSKNTKEMTLMYMDSTATRNTAEKVVYVADSKGEFRSQILLDTNESMLAQNLSNSEPMEQIGQNDHDQQQDEHLSQTEQHMEVPVSVSEDISVPVNTTIELTPTSTPGVYILQNSLMLVLSDDVSNVDFSPSTSHAIDNSENSSPRPVDDVTSSHSDVITTSDVLVYQETGNDEDIKNPILGSAMHEVVASSSHDNVDDSCFSSSPLQGILLEGEDLGTTSLRMDVQP